MLKRWMTQMMVALADPRRRALLRVVVLALALLASWLLPQHRALAVEGYLIPGGQGT